MFSGVRDAVIQSGSVRRTTIRISSRLHRLVHLPESPGTPGLIVRHQRVPVAFTAVFRQYPVIPQPSYIAATGEQLE